MVHFFFFTHTLLLTDIFSYHMPHTHSTSHRAQQQNNYRPHHHYKCELVGPLVSILRWHTTTSPPSLQMWVSGATLVHFMAGIMDPTIAINASRWGCFFNTAGLLYSHFIKNGCSLFRLLSYISYIVFVVYWIHKDWLRPVSTGLDWLSSRLVLTSWGTATSPMWTIVAGLVQLKRKRCNLNQLRSLVAPFRGGTKLHPKTLHMYVFPFFISVTNCIRFLLLFKYDTSKWWSQVATISQWQKDGQWWEIHGPRDVNNVSWDIDMFFLIFSLSVTNYRFIYLLHVGTTLMSNNCDDYKQRVEGL